MPFLSQPLSARTSAFLRLGLIPLALGLTACGSSDNSPPADDSLSISGEVFAAPVGGANVEVKDSAGNTIVAAVSTGSDGRYSLKVPAAHRSSDLVIESTGGSFTDEATGLSGSAGSLSTYLEAGSLSNGASVAVTPETTLLRELIRLGKTPSKAEQLFESAFGYLPDPSVLPVDITDSANATAGQAERLAGLRAAVFSQLGMDLGLTVDEQFELLPVLAEDLADGSLDGQASGSPLNVGTVTLPADLQNRSTLAMFAFRESGKDESGLKDDQLGTPPFAKLALSTTYKVEYVAGSMMGEQVGKNSFTLRIHNRADDTPASGLNVALMPMMHMADMMHATPNEGCSESTTPGDYTCTIYYVMPSVMGSMTMGIWDLKVVIGGMMGESVHFFPKVMMAMGDTPMAQLKGVGDEIPDMMNMPQPRTYYLFNEGADSNGMQLFIAAREDMMSFPAVFVGQTFNANTTYELSVTSVDVEVSTDAGTSWITANDDGNGHWSVSGLGLTAGQSADLRVRLTVNGETKTNDGTAGGVDYATFTVTP